MRTRSFLFLIYFFVLTLVMGMGSLLIRVTRLETLALRYAQIWSRAVLWGFSNLCKVQIRTTGKENLPDGPCLIISQHQSYFDGFIWMTLLPRPAYIIKEELTKIPLVGPMLLLSGMVAINRDAAAKALRSMLKATNQSLSSGKQLIIFPQGTRTLPGEEVPLHAGFVAISKQAAVPLIPVVTNSGAHWPRRGWLMRSGTLTVTIGKAIAPTADRTSLVNEISTAWNFLQQGSNLFQTVDNSVEPT